MTPLRPGWQTSEFWIALVNQVLALLVLAGVLAPTDRDQLGPTLANGVVAVFTLLGSAAVVWKYIHARTALKQARLFVPPDNPPPPPHVGSPAALPLVLLTLCVLPGLAAAQCVPGCPCPAAQPTTLPWRRQVEQQLQQRQSPPPTSQTDPAMMALLQQLVRQNEQILALLASQQRQAMPPIIVLGPGSQIPFGGPPLQQLPLGPPPRQDLPLGTPPKQDVPLGGPPKQDVPLGSPPRQVVPLGTPPVMPPMPRATGWQRYQQSP